jgi:hypothetical protein
MSLKKCTIIYEGVLELITKSRDSIFNNPTDDKFGESYKRLRRIRLQVLFREGGEKSEIADSWI